MKERPILFGGSMVAEILSGSKTRTRRKAIKTSIPGSVRPTDFDDENAMLELELVQFGTRFWKNCPYGKVGDQLWVRESWGVVSHCLDENGDRQEWKPDRPATAIHEMPFGRGYYSGHVIYGADGKFQWSDDDGDGDKSCWKPSIHMPRRASRIQLKITSIRAEYLQEISEEDALAEGCSSDMTEWGAIYWFEGVTGYKSGESYADSAREAFARLWDAINGDGSWEENPCVWVIEFELIKP